MQQQHAAGENRTVWLGREERAAKNGDGENAGPVRPRSWGSRLVDGFFLTSTTVCFAAAICALARIHFLLVQDLLGLGDLVLLLAVGACFTLLGSLAAHALRDHSVGDPAAARRLLLPALGVCWVLLAVATFGRFDAGVPRDYLRVVSAVLVVALGLLIVIDSRPSASRRRSACDPALRPPPPDSRC
jgi:hypothetical protein